KSAPDDHLTTGPDCRMLVSAFGRVGDAGRRPTVGAGIVSAAGVQIAAAIISAPDDHLTAGPDRRILLPTLWRVRGAGCCATVGARIVSRAGVQIGRTASTPTPDDHLTAGPTLPRGPPGH